jgi:hypothetical protein
MGYQIILPLSKAEQANNVSSIGYVPRLCSINKHERAISMIIQKEGWSNSVGFLLSECS